MTKKVLFTLFVGLVVGDRENVGMASSELARVNNSIITLEDLNKKYRDNTRFVQLKSPTKKDVLDELIKRELGVQEAKRQGLDKDPEVIERLNTVLYHALLEKKLTKDLEAIQISDQESKSYYDKNPEIRTSHIFIAVPQEASAVEQKQIRDRLQKIKDGLADGKMSFAEIAQRFSEGPAAHMGGDIDYQSKEKLDSNYYNAAIKLGSPGKVSDIVRTQFGYHIIKLTAIRPWEEADRAQVKRAIFEERRSKIFNKYMSSLRSQAKVSIRDELIKD